MSTIDTLRQFRIGQYAIFDFAASFLVVLILAPLLTRLFLKVRLDIPMLSWLAFTVPFSIVSHLLVGRMTPLTANFLDLSSHYGLKIVIIGLVIVGIEGIKIVPS